MRYLGLFVLGWLLASCGPPVILYTDGLFQAAAPEIVSAWQGLTPGKDARLRALPPNAGLPALVSDLKSLGTGAATKVLVGMALAPEERQALAADFPQCRFRFFDPDAGVDGIFVDVPEAWKAVATAAAVHGEPATVLFPATSDPSARSRFSRAWEQAGGGPLTSWVWPEGGALKLTSGTLFQWVGAEADSRVTVLPATVAVHGNPGTARAPGAKGLAWRIRTDGLGDFLWHAAQSSDRKAQFLPVEILPASR